MTVYIGVDLHARQQTLAFVDTSDAEIKCRVNTPLAFLD